jgi:branched-chain amino acid transport system ATP-binding protein
MSEPLIRMDDVSKRYGAVTVTDHLSFELHEGEALGVLGPNGAGKSTMFNLITGDVRPNGGRIFFRDAEISGLPPHSRCHMGIGRSYQIPHPFAQMTVFENLLVGGAFGKGRAESEAYDDCAGILDRTGLLSKANQLAGSLSLLERKRLELARALSTQPKVLLLDEIAGGLTEAECAELVALIKQIHADGVSIIWIEHVVQALLQVVGRLIVIDFGKLLAEGPPDRVMSDPKVMEVYMGIGA